MFSKKVRDYIRTGVFVSVFASSMLAGCKTDPEINKPVSKITPTVEIVSTSNLESKVKETPVENSCQLPEIYTTGPRDEAGNDLDFVELVRNQVGEISYTGEILESSATGVIADDIILSVGHTHPSDLKVKNDVYDTTFHIDDILLVETSIGQSVDSSTPDIMVATSYEKAFCIPFGKAPKVFSEEEGEREKIRLIAGNYVVDEEDNREWKILEGMGDMTEDFDEKYFAFMPSPMLREEVYMTRPEKYMGTSGGVILHNNRIVGINVATYKDEEGYDNIISYKIEDLSETRPDLWDLLTKENSTAFSEHVEADGIGLLAEYSTPQSEVKQRLDSSINFYWRNSTPDLLEESDLFSVIWSGYLLPEYSGEHKICLYTDDSGILYLDNEPVMVTDVEEKCIDIDLVAGEKVPIKLDYMDHGGEAAALLYWQNLPFFSIQPIGRKNFMPPDGYSPEQK